MTENKAPAELQGSNSNADQPGRPYYEQLRTTLRGTLDKKRKLDDQLATLEDQIFKLEGQYLEETSNSGNIVRGFDGWVKGVSVGGRGADDRRRGRVRDEDRVFSHSSVGWMKVSLLQHPESSCLQMRNLVLMILYRRKKAQTRTHHRTQPRLRVRCLHPCRVRRALLEPLVRPEETRRSAPRTRTMTTKRHRSAARSLIRGNDETAASFLKERFEHGVRRLWIGRYHGPESYICKLGAAVTWNSELQDSRSNKVSRVDPVPVRSPLWLIVAYVCSVGLTGHIAG
jgi:hypothetical protein